MSVTPGKTLLHYRLLDKIGAGGMGEVWLARDTTLDRDVAIKILPEALSNDAERLARFEREAKVLASLNHPNVATVHGYHDANGIRFLVMELVPGETLEDRLKRSAMPVDEAVAVAKKIAEGIEYAHERGIVHRDLKPANVKLTPDGGVKVLDFGLAKAISGDPMTSGPTSTPTVIPTLTSVGTVAGMILGTAAYMSPEQARGTGVDRRADIWAFGAVLWEMLTGKRLFEEETASDTLAAVLRAPIEWSQLPASLPSGLVRLLRRCLERNPKARLRDIGEARIALDGPLDEPAPVAISPTAPPPRSIAKTVIWATALVVTVLALVAVVGILKGAPTAQDTSSVVRFNIGGGAKLSNLAWPRISPDGTMIAFQARGESGKTSIWVRRLDAFDAQELVGTDGASRHWWSPDSRYLAFFTTNQLKKIAATGGPTQLIAEGEGGADGTWGDGGTILFDGRAVDPIHRVDASGGKFTQATTPDPAKGEAGHAWPFMLPDGKHFLYLAMPSTPDKKATIMVAELGKPEAKALVETNSRVEYATGRILYVLDGTLVAQRFDLDELAVEGDPVPIAEHIGFDANGASGFSASTTGALVYVAGTGAGDSDLVWVDRTGREIGRVGAAGPYRDIALSPDETRLAYGLAESRNAAENIWVMDLRRAVASRLTFGVGTEFWPVWSPDGTRIAYAAEKNGSPALFEKDAGGTGAEREIYSDPKGPLGPSSWSRDGKWIALNILPASRRFQIKLLSLQDKRVVDFAVADVNQSGGRFSPDGRYLAYTSNESGVREAYVQTIPPGGGKWQISSGGSGGIQWHADGKELFYMTLADELVAVPVEAGSRFEPGLPKVLFKRALSRSAATATGPRWTVTADGQKFLINAARETRGDDFSVVLNWPEALRSE
ncbi:MAG TPA: protein kinase [Candidatus Polarisedimenticolaceae bacterium]|nr:protein kinase [Candidatus Polarisedimenticolaceae bacterium]